MSAHRFPCSDPDCSFCEGVAEARAEELDETAAEREQDAYDRSVL